VDETTFDLSNYMCLIQTGILLTSPQGLKILPVECVSQSTSPILCPQKRRRSSIYSGNISTFKNKNWGCLRYLNSINIKVVVAVFSLGNHENQFVVSINSDRQVKQKNVRFTPKDYETGEHISH
jgi:hypothetical protein